ncbi:nitrite/sulfite reductase [Agrilactobacillus yilanensis]|uniref:Nitrite/sulfite reductase n=1 Tax=Agrilactobacillus yilanensis TaxID=2485997 RepID=A0ABW4J4G2_9LACO|nr:nitrite/sulfite reductase [Agrilactobacillus yilanensis]
MSYQATWTNEKINKNETSKLKTDGLDVFKMLPDLIKKPFPEIDKSYYMYFKYAGLTVQKPQDAGNFMMRIKVPGGILTVAQATHLAKIAETYGHGYIDLTTRQSVQYHWIPFAKLPEIFAGIENVGLTTTGAEGDITRNVIGNPLADIDRNELFDTQPLVDQVNQRFQGNRDYSNLPRKMKISINSNLFNAGNAEINDLAFTPATKLTDNGKIQGFNVKIGGGLGAMPFLGLAMDIFVRPEQVADVSEAVVSLYRDYGYRRNRSHARLKFLIKDWGVAKFETKLRALMPDLLTAGHDEVIGWSNGTALGLHPQRQAGFYYLGIGIPSGHLAAEDFKAFVALAAQYGHNELRLDHNQDLIIPWLAQADLAAIQASPILQKFSATDQTLMSMGTTCTGAEYCNLANAHTKELFEPLFHTLDDRFNFSNPPRITLTGCGNGCAHRAIADIGIEGTTGKTLMGERVEAYKLSVGGSLLNGGHFAIPLKGKVSQIQLADALTAILSDYQNHKIDNENFYNYYSRQENQYFQDILDEYLVKLTPEMRIK